MNYIKYIVFFDEKPPITKFFMSYEVFQPLIKSTQLLYSLKDGEDCLIRDMMTNPFHRCYTESAMYSFYFIREKMKKKDKNYDFYFYLYEEMMKNKYKYVHLI